MLQADKLLIRVEMAREMGAKAESLRLSVRDEALRCEGAVGALKQAAEALGQQQVSLRDAFAAQEVEESLARAAMDALTSAIAVLGKLRQDAESQHNQQRGKAMQAEATMDLLQAVFAADLAAAERAAEPVKSEALEADPTARQPGHPGAGLAAERRAQEP